MNMHPVKSSEINMIGYDEQTHKMRVSFRRKKPIDYCYVPNDVFSV